MKKQYVLSHPTFDWIDFSESFVSSYEVRGNSLILRVWGCALHEFNNPEFRSIVSSNIECNSVYIAGYSEFQFTGFVSYSIETLLYEEYAPAHPFRKDQQGNHVTVLATKKAATIQPHGITHTFDCVNIQSYGYCTVKITNSGTIDFIFNDDDFVSIESFVHNPHVYTPPFLREIK